MVIINFLVKRLRQVHTVLGRDMCGSDTPVILNSFSPLLPYPSSRGETLAVHSVFSV